ncbi:hypothetical protein ABZ342_32925 [Amycolatopsis sp. NPDC005961]|uniref:hypothetical protein n=1 Tax=Amycolatopsis sp. NPDC005961 TaxID=3156720 RepID=UPI00340054A4
MSKLASISVGDDAPVDVSDQVPDLKPFEVDPIILGRLHKWNLRPSVLAVCVGALFIVLVTWTASITSMFLPGKSNPALWPDLVDFVLRRSGAGGQVPLLRDYPSLVLGVTIGVSICLVYSLYRNAAVLHSAMKSAGCIKYSEAGRVALTAAVDEMNSKLRKWGKYSWLALALAFGFTLAVNLLLKKTLFNFLEPGGLYDDWWASLHPFRVGGLVWLLIGTLGIYMVYAEAVLGLTYVRFLRKCKGDYQFKANMINSDGLYGWSKLRQIISNMEAGVVCTLLSAWAMSFFVQPSLGSPVTVVVLFIFAGVVLYVFIQVTLNFRRQVRTDRNDQRADIGRMLQEAAKEGSVPSSLRMLVAYHQLELVSQIPTTPIRQRWLVAGALSILGPLSAIVVQLVKYFTP